MSQRCQIGDMERLAEIKRGRQLRQPFRNGRRLESLPMVMMPPTIVVAAVPTVVMAATAVMAPPMPVSMPTLDLDDSTIGGAESSGCCGGALHTKRGGAQ